MSRRRKLLSTRRSKKIAPGMRVTFTSKGPGMSVKVPGVGSYSTRTGKVRTTGRKGCGTTMLGIAAFTFVVVSHLAAT